MCGRESRGELTKCPTTTSLTIATTINIGLPATTSWSGFQKQ